MCERKISLLCVTKCCSGNNGVQTKKHGKKLCVALIIIGVHGIISMKKHLDFLLK